VSVAGGKTRLNRYNRGEAVEITYSEDEICYPYEFATLVAMIHDMEVA
jgi:hypothetical protein